MGAVHNFVLGYGRGALCGSSYVSASTASRQLPQASFATYNITDPVTQAAVISTIAMESGDFKYVHHYFPSPVSGQGTRNMQSEAYNLGYAQSISELADRLEAAQAAGP